jgi:hypothetical protein
MSWDFDKKESSKKSYTKFPVGITKVRFLSESPFPRWTHFIKSEKRSINCPGKGCPICDIRHAQKANKETYTYPMSKRMSMWLFNYDTNQVEVCEQGGTFYTDLRDLRDEIVGKGHDLHDAIIKVKRRGTGQDDTSYRLDVDEYKPADEEMLKLIKGLESFEELYKPHTIEQVLDVVNGVPWAKAMGYEEEEVALPVAGESSEDEEIFELK